jgi:hypothetical protein
MLDAVKAPVWGSVVAGRLPLSGIRVGETAAGAVDAWAPLAAKAPVSAIVASPSTAAPPARVGRWSNRMPNLLITKVIHRYKGIAVKLIQRKTMFN